MLPTQLFRIKSIIAIIIVTLIGAFALYHIIDWASNLSKKGWIPPVIFLASVIILFFIVYKYFQPNMPKIIRTDGPNGEDDSQLLKKKLKKLQVIDISTEIKDDIIVPVIGAARVGKSSLIHCLQNSKLKEAAKEERTINLDLRKVPSLSSTIGKNLDKLDSYKNCRLAIIVVTKDLTTYELEAIEFIVKEGGYVVVTLNKTDTITSTEKEETVQAINKKIKKYEPRVSLVLTQVNPQKQIVIIQSEDGSEKEDEFQPQPDINDLVLKLKKYISDRTKGSVLKIK